MSQFDPVIPSLTAALNADSPLLDGARRLGPSRPQQQRTTVGAQAARLRELMGEPGRTALTERLLRSDA